jgi:hypothetical protein
MPGYTFTYICTSSNPTVLEEFHKAVAGSFHPTPRRSRSRLVTVKAFASDLVKLNQADARVGDVDSRIQCWAELVLLVMR